jgi:hypothetical protein
MLLTALAAVVLGGNLWWAHNVQGAHVAGPHLYVSENFDNAGSYAQVASYPVESGVLQEYPDTAYRAYVYTIAVRPDGMLSLCKCLGPYVVDTISPVTRKTVNSLTIGPPSPSQQNYYTAEMAYDAAGRLFVAYFYTINGSPASGVAVYAAGARRHDPPYALLQLPSDDYSLGIAAVGDALYVANQRHGSIDVFSPIENPKRVGRIFGFSGLEGIAADDTGELYACNAGTSQVYAFSPSQRGRVVPDRVLSLKGQHLCPRSQPSSLYVLGNELAVSGTTVYAATDHGYEIAELDGTVDGPQTAIAIGWLPNGSYDWDAGDLGVGPQ